jgi:hypothetical protein
MNFSGFHLVNRRNNQYRLTKSPLLDLLRGKSECRDQFYNYLHQNVCQGWRGRDPGINTESAEEVLERREKVNQCVVASTHFVDRLGKSDIKEIRGNRSEEERHTVSKMPKPANIAVAGGNGCRSHQEQGTLINAFDVLLGRLRR